MVSSLEILLVIVSIIFVGVAMFYLLPKLWPAGDPTKSMICGLIIVVMLLLVMLSTIIVQG